MLLQQLDQFLFRRDPFVGRTGQVDDVGHQAIANLVQDCHFAAGPKAGINGQDSFAAQRWLQE